jgi:DnaJ-class molecular chaperone
MIDRINYYQILGVPEDALLKEIQTAWRTFVKKIHEENAPMQVSDEREYSLGKESNTP